MNYLTQYCNLRYEWKIKGIGIDSASESQIKEMRELREKAIEQSGLSLTELSLICRCRENNILTKVNTYAFKLLY